MCRAPNSQEVFFILEVVRGRFPFETLKAKVMELKQQRYHLPRC